MTNSVSGGHILGVFAALALAGTLLCWRDVTDMSFVLIPLVCMPSEVGPKVLGDAADLFQEGSYGIIMS